MKSLRKTLFVAGLVLAFGPILAGNGSISPGSDGSGVEDAIASTWNTDWFCSKKPQTLFAWQNIGGCVGRQASLAATVTSGSGTTNASHTYDYQLACSEGTIRQTIQFDGGAVTPINSGTFTFNLSGGDTIRLVTTEGPMPISLPAMGRPALLAAAAVMALGLLWLLRNGVRPR